MWATFILFCFLLQRFISDLAHVDGHTKLLCYDSVTIKKKKTMTPFLIINKMTFEISRHESLNIWFSAHIREYLPIYDFPTPGREFIYLEVRNAYLYYIMIYKSSICVQRFNGSFNTLLTLRTFKAV